MRISVIGAGYVGLVSAACFSEIGHTCICVDLDPAKVDRINHGHAPIHEVGLDDMLVRHAGLALRATTDLNAAVLDTDVSFIAVGTPFDGRTIDLNGVRTAARQIGEAIRSKPGRHTVVVKSTVVPGTTDEVVRQELEHASGKKAGLDFGLGMNPEFLTEGVAVRDFMEPDRIVIGGIDDLTVQCLQQVYARFASTPLVVTNNKTAEMIKYTSNAVLAHLISFSNEMGNLCSALGGVDVADVMRGVHLARYFTLSPGDGPSAKASITSFLWAGCGYGGSCLPKDTKALVAHGAAHGVDMPLTSAVIATNQNQPARMLALLKRHIPNLQGAKVSLLGLAFKEGTDDMRESPAIALAKLLLAQGAIVRGHDPVASDSARAALPAEVELVDSLAGAVQGADALLLVTRWPQFQALPELLAGQTPAPVLVDGRRVIDPTAVVRYEGIGR